jgi:hypothetical protein
MIASAVLSFPLALHAYSTRCIDVNITPTVCPL